MFTRALLLLVFSVIPVLARSHHSFASEFIRESVTIEGVITEVWFKNPHIRYYVEVTTPSGEVEIWDTRGGSATNLQRNGGWTEDSIKVGDKITMTGNRGRDGRKLLDIRTVRLPDGTVLPPNGVEEYRHTN